MNAWLFFCVVSITTARNGPLFMAANTSRYESVARTSYGLSFVLRNHVTTRTLHRKNRFSGAVAYNRLPRVPETQQ